MCFQKEASESLYCSTLRQPWGAMIPILKLVRIMMLAKLFQVFYGSSYYCLLPACPNPLSDEELFCNHLVTVEALFSVTTCHPLYQIHMHLKPCKLRMRELLIVCFIWCCHGLSMWSISHLSLKAVFEKLYVKLYQNCYFGCYINWQITSCYTNKETYYSFHVERYYCQPFCH